RRISKPKGHDPVRRYCGLRFHLHVFILVIVMNELTEFTPPRTFECPNCQEIIFLESKVCRFCSAEVDPFLAQARADVQKKIHDAIDQAALIRNLTFGYWGLVILSY